jgi:hypothetical protein
MKSRINNVKVLLLLSQVLQATQELSGHFIQAELIFTKETSVPKEVLKKKYFAWIAFAEHLQGTSFLPSSALLLPLHRVRR